VEEIVCVAAICGWHKDVHVDVEPKIFEIIHTFLKYPSEGIAIFCVKLPFLS
jgi:hypothetical protein